MRNRAILWNPDAPVKQLTIDEIMTRSFLSVFLISLLVCVTSSTSILSSSYENVNSMSVNSVSANSDSCEDSTSVQVTLDFSSILSFYQENGIGSVNYTSYSIYTLDNSRVVESLIDSNVKQHCLTAGDYKFLVEPLETQQSTTSPNDYVYAPVVISVERFNDSSVIFKSSIVEPLILHLQLNVFPWVAGVQQWLYTQSPQGNEAYLNPTYDTSEWTSVTEQPSIASSSHYYFRTQFTLSSLTDISGFNVRLRSVSPITLAINGLQLYSDASTTRSSGMSSTPAWTTINGVVSYLRLGVNTVVLHLRPLDASSGSLQPFFDMSLRLLHDYPFFSFNDAVTVVPTSAAPLFDGDFYDNWSVSSSSGSYTTVHWSYPVDSAYAINKFCIINSASSVMPSQVTLYGMVGSDPQEIQTFSYDPEVFENSAPCWEVSNFMGYREYEARFYCTSDASQIAFSELLLQNMAPSPLFSLQYNVTSLSVPVGGSDVCASPALADGLLIGFCDTEDELPAGVTFNKATGEVCVDGSSSSTMSATISITCHSQLGSNSTSINVTRHYMACSVGEESVAHGEVVVVGPCDTGYSGNKTQTCNNGVLSQVQTSQCVLLPPQNLAYTVADSYEVYSPISLTPTISNIVVLYAINDTLPHGLQFNDQTGVFSGSSHEPCDVYLLVIASNTKGQATTAVHLVFTLRSCEEEGWGSAVSGAEATREECGDGYDGYVSRLCNDGEFGPVSREHCVVRAPAGLQYQSISDGLNLYVFDPIELTPVVTGLNVSFSCSDLPEGLSLNETTGVISGSLRSDRNVTFVVVATNAGGECEASVSLSPVYRPCAADTFISQGYVGDLVWIDCAFRELQGQVSFECVVEGEEVRWVEKESQCHEQSETTTGSIWLFVLLAVIVCVLFIAVISVCAVKKKQQSTVRVRTVNECYI